MIMIVLLLMPDDEDEALAAAAVLEGVVVLLESVSDTVWVRTTGASVGGGLVVEAGIVDVLSTTTIEVDDEELVVDTDDVFDAGEGVNATPPLRASLIPLCNPESRFSFVREAEVGDVRTAADVLEFASALAFVGLDVAGLAALEPLGSAEDGVVATAVLAEADAGLTC